MERIYPYHESHLRSLRFLSEDVRESLAAIGSRDKRCLGLSKELECERRNYLKDLEKAATFYPSSLKRRRRTAFDSLATTPYSNNWNSKRLALSSPLSFSSQQSSSSKEDIAKSSFGSSAVNREKGIKSKDSKARAKILEINGEGPKIPNSVGLGDAPTREEIERKAAFIQRLHSKSRASAIKALENVQMAVKNIDLALTAYELELRRENPSVTGEPANMRERALIDVNPKARSLVEGWDVHLGAHKALFPLFSENPSTSQCTDGRNIGNAEATFGNLEGNCVSAKSPSNLKPSVGVPGRWYIRGRGARPKTSRVYKGRGAGQNSSEKSKKGLQDEAGNAKPDEESQASGELLYCYCRNVFHSNMVGCDSDDCVLEWFHFDCVGLTEAPKGDWYCPDCRLSPDDSSKPKKKKETC